MATQSKLAFSVLVAAVGLGALAAPAPAQTVVLYQNDFETPNVPLIQTCGNVLDQRGINFLFGQPGGVFQQQFTVEAVLIDYLIGGHPWYSDPSGIGGSCALGMLSNVNPDLLSLTFDSQGRDFINLGMDISSIDVLGCGGPFGIAAPRFRLTLVDSPGGVFNFGSGTVLDQVEITGVVGPAPYTFLWTNHVVALDTSGSLDGKVTLVWDLIQSGYAAFDNMVISASDVPGDLVNDPPFADAGAPQTVDEGVLVTLDGTASSDPEDDALTYAWSQIGGPAVVLADANTATPSFTAPLVALGGATLTFQLIVSDGPLFSRPAFVDVTVKNVNRPPIADAGDDQTVVEGSSVTLDGSASYDPDSDALTYAWTQVSGPPVSLSNAADVTPTFTAPLVVLASQTLVFELVVDDGLDLSAPSYVHVVVSNLNTPPVADAGADQAVDESSTVTLDGTGSYDPDNDTLTFHWSQVSGPPVVLADAATATPSFTAPDVTGSQVLVFSLFVRDTSGVDSDASTTEVLVRDLAAPPSCANARPSVEVIWPPNHKMVSVGILGVAAPDDSAVQIFITGVTQDEPINGLGDGDTGPDAVLMGDRVLLRAERSGLGNGRVYHVGFIAIGAQGAQCSGTVTVCMPHDRKDACVDGGALYDSTGH